MKSSVFRVATILLCAASLQAQSVDDGLMVSKKSLFTGVIYGHDEWTDYWEGDAQARQPERRDADDAERHLDGQLRTLSTAST